MKGQMGCIFMLLLSKLQDVKASEISRWSDVHTYRL